MAGTLTANTIQSDITSPPIFRNSTREIGTLCRAWVYFNGSTAVISASFNVSSVLRTAAGVYTVNFTNAFQDTSYVPVANATLTVTADRAYTQISNTSTSALQLSHYEQNSAVDAGVVGIAVFR